MKLKRLARSAFSLLLIGILAGCAADDPWPDDIYTQNVLPGEGGGDIGSANLPYDAGYFTSLYLNGTALSPGGTGSSNVTALDDLSDVTLTGPAGGDMLSYNGTAWYNTPAVGGGDMTKVVYDPDNDGLIDHGANLEGLADDDHLQYHTDGRANTWLATKEEATFSNNMTVNTGTLDAGVVGDLQAVGGVDVAISEANGADPLRVTFVFPSVGLDPNNILFYGRYAGGAGHEIGVEIYNVNTTNWDELGLITLQAAKRWYSFSIFQGSNYVSGGDEVQVRFRHHDTGNNTHDLYLDYLVLQTTFGQGGGVGAVHDEPANGETDIAISSNWAYDHAADTTSVHNFDASGDAPPQAHATDHAVSATDTVFPADPNEDRFLMWDDVPGVLVWAAAAAGYTDEQAQDAVGAMSANTTTITLTYTDGIPELKADIVAEGLQDMVGAMDGGAETGISVTYNDGTGMLDYAVSITQYTDEMAQDTVATLIQNGTGITWAYNDGANTLTPTVTAGSWTTSTVQNDVAVTNSAVLADATGISFTTTASTQYTIRLRVFWATTSASADFKYRLTHAGTTTRVWRMILSAPGNDLPTWQAAVNAFDAADRTLLDTAVATCNIIWEDIILQVGASGGILKLQFAQNTQTAGQSATVFEGSYIEYATS